MFRSFLRTKTAWTFFTSIVVINLLLLAKTGLELFHKVQLPVDTVWAAKVLRVCIETSSEMAPQINQEFLAYAIFIGIGIAGLLARPEPNKFGWPGFRTQQEGNARKSPSWS